MPGNRIWIAWDDDLLDVDVLNLDVQFIHCRISIRCAHLSILVTVVYGANDSVSRRGLWQSLVTLADSISDEPWIVGGDFNTVVDMSEVCGASADIHLAMNEFRDCILGTGLIHLPVQGELFSWHNCSEGDRSLWKRLDRLLVNDAWLRLWPNSHYQCLNARTSDHSPLVLRGDTDNHMKKKGDLSVNVKLAAEFLATVQQLLQIDRHNTLLLCLEKCCKLVFFKATKLEQVMLQQRAKIQWLKGGDQCSRIFFRKRLLGGDRRRDFIDLRYLRPWARHVLTQEESQALVQSVTREEIKDAFFDIAEDKAPGPDGYSSGFYKAAWPLLGLPMRCALKVDLRKAYDTVEWDFLSAVLQMFGFPGTFIGWVEECVTTPMFSVCINGNPHGFFKGSRGLRQGDPMSPFLFVMIMEMTSSSSVKRMWLRFGYLDTGWPSSPNCPGYMPIHKRVSLFSPVQHRMFGNNYLQHYISRRVTFPSVGLKDGKAFSCPLRENSINQIGAHVTKCLLGNGLHITERGHQRGGKKDAYLLWKGNSAVGYPKVAWNVVCKPIEEGGQGIRDILALNKALMSRHLWNVIQNNQSSIWVKWIAHTRLRHKSVWTVDVKGGSWGWRKILRLRSALLPYIEFKIGDGESFSLWHDPWHSLGSLITRFPRGPGRTSIPEATKLSAVLVDGDWSWPPITDLECIEILHVLPNIHNGSDSILWRGGGFSTKAVYEIFRNRGPKCIRILKGTVRFTWPNRAWAVDIAWASKRWNGRHIVQAAYRALLAAIVYHIWQERKRRVFQQSMRPSSTIARIVVDEMRQKIISIELPESLVLEDYIDFGESPGLSGVLLDA
ncbi:UNVERIFIED_CONTAM: putative ribonuclease H protein [Sesamum angustifolium]|uniref:Ribonuclease H protein n=1 Tax=Sesamum angustifolium TaxID=2727405 RepID=A0AAW2JHE2_9LAMI